MACPPDPPGQPAVRMVVRSWFGERELTHAEAEAFHLRQAAKLAGTSLVSRQLRQRDHLAQAAAHRTAELVPMPRRHTLPQPAARESDADRRALNYAVLWAASMTRYARGTS